MRDWLVVDAGLPLMERHWKGERGVTIDSCITRAAQAYDVRPSYILGKSREREHVQARWHAARLMREEGLSLPQIGRALNRHHTTIMQALKAPYPQPRKISVGGTSNRLRGQQVGQYVEDASAKEGSVA